MLNDWTLLTDNNKTKKEKNKKTNNMELLDKLNWRYAAKAMNTKVPQEKIDNIIEAISLAPTSSGLQPFEVIVITNQEVKEKSDLFLGINL
jgi:nitroreductase